MYSSAATANVFAPALLLGRALRAPAVGSTPIPICLSHSRALLTRLRKPEFANLAQRAPGVGLELPG